MRFNSDDRIEAKIRNMQQEIQNHSVEKSLALYCFLEHECLTIDYWVVGCSGIRLFCVKLRSTANCYDFEDGHNVGSQKLSLCDSPRYPVCPIGDRGCPRSGRELHRPLVQSDTLS